MQPGVIHETPQRDGTFALYRTVVGSLVLYTRPHKLKRLDFCSIPDCGMQPGVIHETPQRDGSFALYRTVVGSLVLYTRPHKEMGLLLFTGLWQVAWCYTRDPTKRWEFCSIPDCGMQPGVIHETLQRDGTFALYRTVVGSLVLYTRPHKEIGLLRYTGLWYVTWCYTRDPTKRWDFCSIPDCGMQPGVIHETPQRDGSFALYRTVVGSLVLYTRPHKEMGLLLFTGLWQVAWCYTRDPTKRWEFCSIPDCGMQHGVIHETLQRDGTFALYRTVVCSLVLYTRPYKEMGLLRYTGLWYVTWCYTRDPTKRWDFCSIPDCGMQPGVIHETPQRDGTFALYRTVVGSLGVIQETPRRDGTFALYRTVVGSLGVIHETPQIKEIGLLRYTGLWQVAWCYIRDPTKRWEFCSIPDSGRQTRCYTRDPTMRWDFCSIPDCGRQSRCYTRDPTKRWEFCSIPDCGRQTRCYTRDPTRR